MTLARDSVGQVQIRADAVRAPEIRADAVRSSEILDGSVRLRDLAPAARTALDAPRVRHVEVFFEPVVTCPDASLDDCLDLALIRLPAGSWLVQAKFTLSGTITSLVRCGLSLDDDTIDEATELGQPIDSETPFESEQIALAAVLTTAPDVALTPVGLRCEEREGDNLFVFNVKLTALEVTTAR